MSKQDIVIYPGFFDPITMGHFDIVSRAAHIHKTVIVAVAEDSPKKSLLSTQERFDLVSEVCSEHQNVQVELFSGLLMNYVKDKNASVILRGIRTVSDFEYEFQMSLANKVLENSVETIFMMTDAKYSFLSSTLIKEIARLGGSIKGMVPKCVEQKMKGIYGHELSC